MKASSKIYVAGHRGLVGSALMRRLKQAGYEHLITKTRDELDLRNQQATHDFFDSEKPDVVFLAAAKVGGIGANSTYPAQFIYDNLSIANHVVHGAWRSGVKKLMFLGSSCIYPKHAPQPMKEEHLLSGPLEPTNEPYAIAKIAGIKLCEAYHREYGAPFISVMPTNLYGPGDNYDLNTSHVLPALLRKCHEAKVRGDMRLGVWGTGSPKREFLYSEDLADACVFLMERFGAEDIGSHLNIGAGQEISIKSLAEMISQVVGFEGSLEFDPAKPDGTPRKLLDSTKLQSLGWQATTTLRQGLENTYHSFLAEQLKSKRASA
jgi:GDP-L-fucose synthase